MRVCRCLVFLPGLPITLFRALCRLPLFSCLFLKLLCLSDLPAQFRKLSCLCPPIGQLRLSSLQLVLLLPPFLYAPGKRFRMLPLFLCFFPDCKESVFFFVKRLFGFFDLVKKLQRLCCPLLCFRTALQLLVQRLLRFPLSFGSLLCCLDKRGLPLLHHCQAAAHSGCQLLLILKPAELPFQFPGDADILHEFFLLADRILLSAALLQLSKRTVQLVKIPHDLLRCSKGGHPVVTLPGSFICRCLGHPSRFPKEAAQRIQKRRQLLHIGGGYPLIAHQPAFDLEEFIPAGESFRHLDPVHLVLADRPQPGKLCLPVFFPVRQLIDDLLVLLCIEKFSEDQLFFIGTGPKQLHKFALGDHGHLHELFLRQPDDLRQLPVCLLHISGEYRGIRKCQ